MLIVGRKISIDKKTMNVTSTISQYLCTTSVSATDKLATIKQKDTTFSSPNVFSIHPKIVTCTTAPEIEPKVIIKAISLAVKPKR
ncbi:hypothetical protein D3C71_1801990 [compost metagenome]